MENTKTRRLSHPILLVFGLFFAIPDRSDAEPVRHRPVTDGTITFQIDAERLSGLGFGLIPQGSLGGDESVDQMVFEVDPSNTPVAEFSSSGFLGFAGGPLMTCGAMLLDRPGERMVIGNFGLCGRLGEGFRLESTLEHGVEPLLLFDLGDIRIDFDPRRGELDMQAELLLSSAWADRLLVSDAAGARMGTVLIHVFVEGSRGLVSATTTCDPPDRQQPEGAVADETGSDVVVADLQSVVRYTSVGNTAAFAVGTTACNLGTARASWIAYTNQHPVIIQNMYRLKNDRFEQIGMSWVKHGFFAVSETFCGFCYDVTDGSQLGIGCSDPYSAHLNGVQSNMSPRSTVNAHNGYFPYPWSGPTAQSSVERRVQVQWSDLDPLLNPSAKYFVEGHYVNADDCRAGTQDNNASYRRVDVSCRLCVGGNYNGQPCTGSGDCLNGTCSPPGACTIPGVFYIVLNPAWTTQAGQAAVHAWHDVDPDVFESDARVPGEGLFIVATKASPLGNGYYRYTYAVQNVNSDRSARSFRVDLPSFAQVQNPYFHSIPHHSGEPYSVLPWTYELTPDAITWSTDTYEANPNANALRFSSMFTFGFDANVDPVQGKVKIGLFKPGSPTEFTAGALVPPVVDRDCNLNGVADRCDIDCAAEGCSPLTCGTSLNCNGNQVPDDCEDDCNLNSVADDCDLAQCQPGELWCGDCNENIVPDGCEADCDEDGIIDECETVTDNDQDGVDDCVDLCPFTTPPLACLPPLDTSVVCCFESGIYLEYIYTWRQCVSLAGLPVCDDPPMCPGTPCLESACRNGCLISDVDSDGDLDLRDFGAMQCCMGEFESASASCPTQFSFDEDGNVDLVDYSEFSKRSEGPILPAHRRPASPWTDAASGP